MTAARRWRVIASWLVLGVCCLLTACAGSPRRAADDILPHGLVRSPGVADRPMASVAAPAPPVASESSAGRADTRSLDRLPAPPTAPTTPATGSSTPTDPATRIEGDTASRVSSAPPRPLEASTPSADDRSVAVNAPAGADEPTNSSDDTTSAPDPGDRSAQASGIQLGPGDVIQMRMFGQPDMNTQSFVSDSGEVSLPLIDSFDVGGLTPSEAQTRIAQAYARRGYFRDPQVSVTLVEHRSQQIAVLGEVRQPGRFALDSRTSLLDALALAGGIAPQGSRQVTIIRRQGDTEKHYRVDIDALVAGQATRSDVTLGAGDTVYVPEAPLFYIYGQVNQPNAYAIQPGMTVMQAISTGGGLTDRGSDSRIVIRRRVAGHMVTLDAELDQQIQPGDTLFVKERFF